MRALAHAALLLAAALGPGRVCAQDDPEALIERAIELREQGDDEAALPLLERAVELDATPRALAQLGLVEQALGDFPNAETHLGSALATSGDAWVEPRRAPLQRALAAIEARLGSLSVRLAAPVRGARLRVAGERYRLPLDDRLRVIAGTVRFEVEAPGHATVRRTLEVEPGGIAHELVTLEPIAAERDAAIADAGSGAPTDGGSVVEEWWFWTLALAVVGAGVGVGLGVGLSDTAPNEDRYAPSDLGTVVFAVGF